ncbi:unnamed protein product [Symbiodinium natans]|uniref:Uncharacterized protein n=1 Tax=Symbiodinium natans TaxID=878477 RepID=A0A812R735_9DINO|nr:unnamed protein product [Symbiodinium natans]
MEMRSSNELREALRLAEQATVHTLQSRIDELLARKPPPTPDAQDAVKVEEEKVQPVLRVDLRAARPQWTKLSNVVRAGAALAKASDSPLRQTSRD